MKSKKIKKGTKGYIKYLKIYDLIFILCNGVISALIFIIGMLIWRTNANIATIVAVCSLLPACKRILNIIMVFKFRGISNEDYEYIINHLKPKSSSYVYSDMLFATEKCFLLFDHAIINGNRMAAYSLMNKDKIDFAGEYLNKGFQIRGFDITVEVYSEKEEYISAAVQISESEAETNQAAIEYLCSLFV